MKLRKLLAVFVPLALLLVTAPLVLAANGGDSSTTVEWKQIVGNPAPDCAGTHTFLAGGSAWSTKGGKAKFDLDTGALKFEVKGLVLAEGNYIGTPANITAIDVVLVCDTDTSAGGPTTFTLQSGLPLSAQGDAKVPKGTVVDVTHLLYKGEPDMALLIINPNNSKRIAHGAVRVRKP